MKDLVNIVLRPISERYFCLVQAVVELENGDLNRAVRIAERRLSKTFPKDTISGFELVSIKVV